MLYDLSSSYVEGRCCPLAKLGYSRDTVKGKLQITYGLTCSPEGRPVAIGVHEGNITDQQTLPGAVNAVAERFGIEHVVVVGDRGMITQAHAATLTEQGIEFITALKAVQVRALVTSGDLQLSLFDQVNLAQITSEQYPAERLVVCRNPAVAAERARKRESMLTATERELDKVSAMVSGLRGTLRNATAGKIGERAGKVSNKYKMAKHFELQIADGAFAYQRNTEQITAEAALDGFYVIRTTSHHPSLTTPAIVRAYKQLRWPSARSERSRTRSRSGRSATTSPPASARTHSSACSPTTSPSNSARASHRCCSTTKPHKRPPTPSPQPHAPHKPSPKPQAPAPPTVTPPTPSPTCSTTSPRSAANTVRIGPSEHTFTRLTTPTALQPPPSN